MRSPARSDHDADVIRARLRALLVEGGPPAGWVPAPPAAEPDDEPDDHLDDDPDDDLDDEPDVEPGHRLGGQPEDDLDDGWAGARDRTAAGVPVVGRHRSPGPTTRLAPGRPAATSLWAAAVLAVALLLGWTWLQRPDVTAAPDAAGAPASTTPVGATPVSAAAAASSAPGAPATSGSAPASVVVSVVGQVATPGLVTLPAGARVADALSAAGGLLPGADPAAVNAAALLADGQQIAVGVPGAAAPAGTAGSSAGTAPVDLNAATAADLDALPGVGPVLAQRIVDYRGAHGRFASVEQLDDVDGIGPAVYAQLAPRVRV